MNTNDWSTTKKELELEKRCKDEGDYEEVFFQVDPTFKPLFKDWKYIAIAGIFTDKIEKKLKEVYKGKNINDFTIKQILEELMK